MAVGGQGLAGRGQPEGHLAVVLPRPGAPPMPSASRASIAFIRSTSSRISRTLSAGRTRLTLAMWRGLISFDRSKNASASSKRPFPE